MNENNRDSTSNPIEAARMKSNQDADRTTQALDNAAKVAQFTPIAAYAKGYQAFRGLDNKLTGGKISRGLSKTANATAPGTRTLGKLGSTSFANNTIGAADRIKNMKEAGANSNLAATSGAAKNSSMPKSDKGGTDSSKTGNNKTDDNKSKSSSADGKKSDSKSSIGSSSNDKSDSKKKGKGKGFFFASIIDDGNDKEEPGFEAGSLEVLLGKLTPAKIILLCLGFIVGFLILFIVAVINSVYVKKSFFTSQAFGEISANSSKSTKSGAKIGNVTKPGDNSYTKDDYDFSDYKEDYQEQTGEDGSDTRDNSSRDKKLTSIRDIFPKEIYISYYNIGNVFKKKPIICTGNECDSVAEVRFYQKVSDIAYRYRKLYNVELDWPLIVATVLIKSSDDKEEIFSSNLNDYTVRQLNNTKTTMSFDWENDYTKIDGYEYLSPNDSRYDLQILAKNMVKKKTVQTCTKSETPSSSNPNPPNTVVKTLEIEDIEDSLIEEDKANNGIAGYYLVCEAGTKHNMKSTYTLDKDKYDEFLNEYIEKKYYIKVEKSSNGSGSATDEYFDIPYGTDLASTMVNVATREIGTNEADGGFYKYWKHYSQFKDYDNIGWCACFVDWVIRHTEFEGVQLTSVIKQSDCSPKNFMDYFNSSTDANIQFHYNIKYYQYKDRGPDYTPKVGDIVFFSNTEADGKTCKWNNPSDPNNKIAHVGIVIGIEGNKLFTIEGNTGNMVNKRTHLVDFASSDVQCVIGYGSWY